MDTRKEAAASVASSTSTNGIAGGHAIAAKLEDGKQSVTPTELESRLDVFPSPSTSSPTPLPCSPLTFGNLVKLQSLMQEERKKNQKLHDDQKHVAEKLADLKGKFAALTVLVHTKNAEKSLPNQSLQARSANVETNGLLLPPSITNAPEQGTDSKTLWDRVKATGGNVDVLANQLLEEQKPQLVSALKTMYSVAHNLSIDEGQVAAKPAHTATETPNGTGTGKGHSDLMGLCFPRVKRTENLNPAAKQFSPLTFDNIKFEEAKVVNGLSSSIHNPNGE
ncbi:hypothetical protein S7711_10963 [Stachybotrys chartarum IBT 7711]|uniref:Uncharacterized protein n=1 Tax=Stachybotrys chartarum (strain CBS 109288 / IBT 7711) TaxID=1280523 RepID=A0A084AS14_STACB|nr:hypothetical protein S7711_10963 [Stachybotrys chartarum IBT 7711]